MSHLPGTLLAAWLAILGVAVPDFACAAPPFAGDCCPDGGSAPCAESAPAGPVDADTACCATAPAGAQAVFLAPARAEQQRLTDSGSPDLPILPDSRFAPSQAVAWHDTAFAIVNVAERNGSSTYLRTLRLRL